MEYITINFI